MILAGIGSSRTKVVEELKVSFGPSYTESKACFSP